MILFHIKPLSITAKINKHISSNLYFQLHLGNGPEFTKQIQMNLNLYDFIMSSTNLLNNDICAICAHLDLIHVLFDSNSQAFYAVMQNDM